MTYKLSTPELWPADYNATLAEERKGDIIRGLKSEGRITISGGNLTYQGNIASTEGTLYNVAYKALEASLSWADKTANVQNLRVNALSGAVQLQLLQGGTALQLVNITGLSYTAGTVLQLRLQVFGTSPTTIRAKVWSSAGTEPSAWQASTTDATAALRTSGSIGLRSYLSGTATDVPVTTRFSGLVVSPPQ